MTAHSFISWYEKYKIAAQNQFTTDKVQKQNARTPATAEIRALIKETENQTVNASESVFYPQYAW